MRNFSLSRKLINIGVVIAAFSELACHAEPKPKSDTLDAKTDEFIRREKIELGNGAVGNPLKSDAISLADLEKVTGSPMTHESVTPSFDETATVEIFGFKKPDEQAGIQISYFRDPKKARQWGVETFLFREQGRANDGKSVEISNHSIGDLCIRPKRWARDPHGFDTGDTDKTFCVFVRGCTVVCVDSARNLTPSIPVIDIARKIDALLLKASHSNLEADTSRK